MNGGRRARQSFIESIEPRILLTVFAPDLSYQPPFQPPGTQTENVIPLSKKRYLVSFETKPDGLSNSGPVLNGISIHKGAGREAQACVRHDIAECCLIFKEAIGSCFAEAFDSGILNLFLAALPDISALREAENVLNVEDLFLSRLRFVC